MGSDVTSTIKDTTMKTIKAIADDGVSALIEDMCILESNSNDAFNIIVNVLITYNNISEDIEMDVCEEISDIIEANGLTDDGQATFEALWRMFQI